ncbi:MAG TPA: hypothetical protein VKV03_08805 [Candidatus Binataceae bacterium]|nr:hypothetical protein [Candidatus Binataceae bacterium]
MTIRGRFAIAVVLWILLAVPCARAQSGGGHDGWIEETNGKTLADDPGHSYLDPASVHRGDDGLIYFNESNGVTKPEEAGRSGFMKDAYDCARNIKYMCVGAGDWRNDPKSTIHTSDDPALSIYRKYLCGDDVPTESAATKSAN